MYVIYTLTVHSIFVLLALTHLVFTGKNYYALYIGGDSC